MIRESGRSSIPETVVLEPMDRGVLDRPFAGDDEGFEPVASAMIRRRKGQ
jgi:hypothetical protein